MATRRHVTAVFVLGGLLIAGLGATCPDRHPAPLHIAMNATGPDTLLGVIMQCNFNALVELDAIPSHDTTVMAFATFSRRTNNSDSILADLRSTEPSLPLTIRLVSDSLVITLPTIADTLRGSITDHYYLTATGPWLCTNRFPFASDPRLGGASFRPGAQSGQWWLYRAVPIG